MGRRILKVIEFLVDIIFLALARHIPIVGLILGIVYFVKDRKIEALMFIVFAVWGYFDNVKLMSEIINSIF